MQVLLQYQSKSYYIIGQEVYYSIGRFITLSGSYYIIGRFLLHYRAVITVSGVYYIIGWYTGLYTCGQLQICVPISSIAAHRTDIHGHLFLEVKMNHQDKYFDIVAPDV